MSGWAVPWGRILAAPSFQDDPLAEAKAEFRRRVDANERTRRNHEAQIIADCQSHARDNPRAASFYAAKAAWLVAARRA